MEGRGRFKSAPTTDLSDAEPIHSSAVAKDDLCDGLKGAGGEPSWRGVRVKLSKGIGDTRSSDTPSGLDVFKSVEPPDPL